MHLGIYGSCAFVPFLDCKLETFYFENAKNKLILLAFGVSGFSVQVHFLI